VAVKQMFEIAAEQLRLARRIDELIDIAEDRFEGRDPAEALELALELVDLVQRSMVLESNVISIRENAEQLFNARCPGGPH
jgi:hypothetical protein